MPSRVPGLAGRLKCHAPPEQVIDHCPRLSLELGKPLVHVAALEMCPQGRNRDEDGGANRCHLKLDRHLPELLDTARAHGTAVAHERGRLAVPLGIDPVDRILQHGRRAVVVFRGDEHEPVRRGDGGGPLFHHLVLVWSAAGRGRRHRLVKEGHRKITKIEQPRFDAVALLEMLKNPLCRLLREPALTRAPDDYRYGHHGFLLSWPTLRLSPPAPMKTSATRPDRIRRPMRRPFRATAAGALVVITRFPPV